MKVLISPQEKVSSVYVTDWQKDSHGQWHPVETVIEKCMRVAQKVEDNAVFDVCSPLFWVDCPYDCDDLHRLYYKDGELHVLPEDVPHPDPDPEEPENLED